MKRILLLAALLAVLTGLSSCESNNDYEPTLYETIAGRTWSGDMDMHDNGRLLIDHIYFGSNGRGEDVFTYATTDIIWDTFPIRWDTDDYHATIYIDYYGELASCEIRYARIDRGVLCGDLWADGVFVKHVALYME